MDRLELVPGDVRGGGNITLQKSPDFRSDKNTSMCDTYLTERFVPIAENDFQYVYRSISSNGLHIVCDAPRRVSSGDSVTVNVSVSRNDSIVSGASVSLLLRGMDGTVFYEESVTVTDSQPVFTVSVPEGTGIFCEWFVRAYHVDYQGVNFRQEVMVDTGLDFDFNVVGDKDTIQIGETANIVGVLTGTSGDDVIGIPGQTVNFYELWTPGLRVSAPIVQSGDTVDIKAQLIDSTDGSLVREAGHTVNVYMEDVPRVPTTLDVNIDKTILSYADGDKANITLTLYDQFNEPVAGEYISFYLDGELRTRFLTNGDGQVTGLSYHSTGVGDVTFTFECSNLQETYSIEDCWYYNSNVLKEYTQIPLNVSLPSTFHLSYLLQQDSSRSYSAPYLVIGENSNSRLLIGQYAKAGTNGIIAYKPSSTNFPFGTNTLVAPNENLIEFEYGGGNYTYSLNGSSMTVTNQNISLDKLLYVETSNEVCYIKNIKIKPL